MPVTDHEAIRQACQPLARWWHAYQHGTQPDPDRLARAASRARLLGPVPGPVGHALALILEAPEDLDYPELEAAFTCIARAADQPPTRPTRARVAESPHQAACPHLEMSSRNGPTVMA